MSGQNAQMDPALVQAQAVLFQDVYLPALAEKCAALNIQLPDEDSIVAGLEIIGEIKKRAQSQTSNLVKAGHAALCEATGRQTPEQRAVAEMESKQAAAVAGSDRIKQAIATLAAATRS